MMHDGYKSHDSFSEVLRQFSEPESKFAPYVFWFYDEDLNALGIKPQNMAHELSKKGFNPGYAHARTNYAADLLHAVHPHVRPFPKEQWLSDEWFAVLERQAKQAAADHTHACYADEYGWPSLQAGGRLASADPTLKSKNLRFQRIEIKKGTTQDLTRCTFAVAGNVIRRESTSFVEFPQPDAWIWTRSSFDQTPPGQNNTLPLNMASAWSEERDAVCIFHIQLPSEGKYRLFACWDWSEHNTAAAEYAINQTVFTADQRTQPFRWNLLGELFLPAGECTVTVTGGSDGRLWVDGIKAVGEEGCEIIIDDLQNTDRTVAYLDSDSLTVLDGPVYTAEDACCVYLFTLQEHRGYDGSTIDYLQNRLTNLFIQTAWDPVTEKLGQYMGKGKPVNGIFSDHEGDYGYKLAWSEDLRLLFSQKYDEDIRRILPLLIDRDIQGKDIVWRFRWFDTVSDIYTAHFHRLSQEAEKHGCYYTMHTWEESLQLQASNVGDIFKLNRGVSLPGTDALCSVVYNPQNFKDTFSIAEFEGVRFMDEVMALNDLEHYTPDELKKQANYLASYGVSHVICHAVKMTRPFAQSVVTPDFYNIDPCWQAMGQYTGFLRRTSYLNSLGRANARVLLLNPLDSMYALAESDVFDIDYEMLDIGGGIPKICASYGGEAGEINRQYGEIIRILTRSHIEHLTADKEYIHRMTVQADTLVYGDYAFHTAVIPRLSVLDLEVLKKITEFAKAGGQVWWIAPVTADTLQNGRDDPEAKEALTVLLSLPNVHIIQKPDDLTLCSPIRCEESLPDLLSHWRIIDEKHFILLCNNSNASVSITVHLDGIHGKTTLLYPADGARRSICSHQDHYGLSLSLDFVPYEAVYVVVDPTQEQEPAVASTIPEERQLTDFTVAIDRGNTSRSLIHPIPPTVTDRMRLILSKGSFDNAERPDVESITLLCDGKEVLHCPVNREYHVCFDEAAEILLNLPCQKIDAVQITSRRGLTAYRVEVGTDTWWRTVAELDSYSQNEIIHSIDYPRGIYSVPLTDWSSWEFLPEQFAGVITYMTTFHISQADIRKTVLLEIEKFAGSVLPVLNGIPLGGKMFAPFRFSLNQALKLGENKLELRVSNTIVSNITSRHGGIKQIALKIFE